MELLKFEGSY